MAKRKRRLRDRITSVMYATFITVAFVLVTSLMRDDKSTAMASVLAGSALLPLLAYLRILLRPRRRVTRATKRPARPTRKRR